MLGNDAYSVKMDGTGRATKRKRRFLRPIKLYQEMLGDRGDNFAKDKDKYCIEVGPKRRSQDDIFDHKRRSQDNDVDRTMRSQDNEIDHKRRSQDNDDNRNVRSQVDVVDPKIRSKDKVHGRSGDIYGNPDNSQGLFN